MSDLRKAAQQAMEYLAAWSVGESPNASAVNDLIAELEAALAQPEQEPVAWMHPSGEGYDSAFRDHSTVVVCTGNKWEGWMPLYTHPPQRKPLTETEIYEVLGYGSTAQYNHVPKYALEFARAIEKAHGIGDK